MYENMSITVKKFNLTFQNTSIFGYPTYLKIKFDEFAVRTADSNFTPKFNSDHLISYKLVALNKFCIIYSSFPPKKN